MDDRLSMQMAFLNEIERLKAVYRRNRTADPERHENSAEHSWHVALMALLLSEHADAPALDTLKVVKMLLVHDLVEVYAGDTWAYDSAGVAGQPAREEAAATRLFGLLPDDQRAELHSLWKEFEERSSPEAAYAAAIDALQPLSNHLLFGRPEECAERPTRAEVLDRKRHVEAASRALWSLARRLIDLGVEKGLYRR